MNKKKIIGICVVIFVIVFIAVCIAIVQFSKKDLEEAKKGLEETQEKYGWVEKENIDVLVAKFNTQVMDNDSSSLNPASTDYLTESNNEYWLEQDARLRTDFNITTGIKSAEIEKFKRKSVMKTYYQKAGIPTARWCVTADVTEAQAFAKTVGWPVIAKPDNGVGANGTHKFKNKTELNKFFQQEGPNAANYILEEFVDGEIVTFDGVADANAEPIYAASHVTPDSIMEIAHGKKPMWYYVAPEISPELRKMGEAALKAFGAKSRFFHLEFFRLKTAKPSLGNAGDILGLEVNMRPAGGYTVDMLNYAGGLDLYQIWADMVAFGAAHHPLARYHRDCCCAGRHDELRYRMPHEELLKKYRSCLNAAPRLPEVLAREMGDQLYIASFEDAAAMQAFRRDALARPRE